MAERCGQPISQRLFDLGSLAPALAIILILASLKRRTKFKLEYLDGRPGLLIPINFLGGLSNRYTIAATFGATASTWLTIAFAQLFGPPIFSLPGPSWLKVFYSLIAVLVYGILFYPFFACLTTEYKLVGSLLGFLYGAIRFSFQVVFVIQDYCELRYAGEAFSNITILGRVPALACLLFIVLRFGIILFLEVRKRDRPPDATIEHQGSRKRLVAELGITSVKQLLSQGATLNVVELKWYIKLLHFFYKPRADFKFSTQVVSTVVVAAIFIFQITMAMFSVFELFEASFNLLFGPQANTVEVPKFFHVWRDGCKAGAVLFAFFSFGLILHFMKCHREHVLQLYRGERRISKDVVVSLKTLVGRSLRFSGFFIAYALLGLLISLLLWTIAMFCLALFIEFEPIRKMIRSFAEAVIPTVIMAVFLWLFQVIVLGWFVFRDRDFPDYTVTIDNRRLYSIMGYFFFFYNIILGLFSFLVQRLLKTLLLGLLFMSRIDRPVLMPGFQTWDKGFLAYLGFIHVLVAHRHPVLLMFCQLLIDRNYDLNLVKSSEERPSTKYMQHKDERRAGSPTTIRRELRPPRLSRKAANRWLVTMTLLRNPALIRYRQQGRARPPVKIDSGEINLGVV